MKILIAISILALGVLLWASTAIAQHIRKARLRRRRALAAVLALAPDIEPAMIELPVQEFGYPELCHYGERIVSHTLTSALPLARVVEPGELTELAPAPSMDARAFHMKSERPSHGALTRLPHTRTN